MTKPVTTSFSPRPGMPACPRRHGWVIAGLLLVAHSLQGALRELPATPPEPREVAKLARTHNLLRSATPENRRVVRILFFGQSIIAQKWWLNVRDRLRAAYPHAELVIANHAINGFSAELSHQIVETQVAAFRPDLVILNSYGEEAPMVELVTRLATRTHADLLVQTDHIHQHTDLPVPADPAQLTPEQCWLYRDYVVLPRLAEQWGACLADIRARWREYLDQHRLAPAALLTDSVHLNDEGNELMAALVWRYLAPEIPVPAGDPDNEPRVRTLRVGMTSSGGTVRWACASTAKTWKW